MEVEKPLQLPDVDDENENFKWNVTEIQPHIDVINDTQSLESNSKPSSQPAQNLSNSDRGAFCNLVVASVSTTYSSPAHWNSSTQTPSKMVAVKNEPDLTTYIQGSSDEMVNLSSSYHPNNIDYTLSSSTCELYMCRFCNSTFAEQNDLQHHIAVHTDGGALEEPIEEVGDKIQWNDAVHMRFILEDESDTELELQLEVHVSETSEEVPGPSSANDFSSPQSDEGEYACRYCTLAFAKETDFEIHIETHAEYKSQVLAIAIKDEVSQSSEDDQLSLLTPADNLLETMDDPLNVKEDNTVHNGYKAPDDDVNTSGSSMLEMVFSCELCSFTSKHMSNFRQHALVHTKHADDMDKNILKPSKRFACIICDYKCNVKSDFLKHKRTHAKDKRYKCKFCEYRGPYSVLNQHMLKHTNEKLFCCTICSYRSNYKHGLDRHMRRHSRASGPLNTDQLAHVDEKLFSCNLCSFKSTLNGYLTKHLQTHAREKWYYCQTCNSKFLKETQLQAHMVTHTHEMPVVKLEQDIKEQNEVGGLMSKIDKPTAQKRFSCSVCSYTSNYNSTLREHILIHTGEKPFKCNICSCRFRQSSHIYTHLRKMHPDCKPCREFMRKEETVGNFKKQIVTHARQTSVSCRFCDYKCKNKHALAGHMKTHNNERFTCNVCNSKFRQLRYLSRHMLTHTDDKPFPKLKKRIIKQEKVTNLESVTVKHAAPKRFSCNICDNKFQYNYMLVKHVQTHTKEKRRNSELPNTQQSKGQALNQHTEQKPFACNACDYKSSNTRSLAVHVRMHTVDKPSKSEVYNLKFRQQNHLSRQILTHRDDKLPPRFFCNVCKYKCQYNYRLVKHMRTHATEKVFSELPCTLGDENPLITLNQPTEQKLINFENHAMETPASKRFSCNDCGYKCNFNYELVRHLRVHEGETPFKCIICNAKFQRKQDLRRHMLTHANEKLDLNLKKPGLKSEPDKLKTRMVTHKTPKRLSCNDCGYQCNFNSELTRHMRVHMGEPPFKCTVCDAKFRRNIYFGRHMLTHRSEKVDLHLEKPVIKKSLNNWKIRIVTQKDQKRFSCNTCGYKCKFNYMLLKHMRSHGINCPIKCTLCNSKFQLQEQLARHMLLHTGGPSHFDANKHTSEQKIVPDAVSKQLTCNICGYKCNLNSDLMRHMHTHTEKSFKCIVCKSTFGRQQHLNKHMLDHTFQNTLPDQSKCPTKQMDNLEN